MSHATAASIVVNCNSTRGAVCRHSFLLQAQPFILQVQPDLEEEGSVWVQLRDWLQQDRPAGLQRGMAGMRI